MDSLLPHERALSYMGLDNPALRGFVAFAMTNALVFYGKPDFAFDSDGHARDWEFTSPGLRSTWFPWWIPGVSAGVIFSLFI